MAIVKWDPFDTRPFWGRRLTRDFWPEIWEEEGMPLNIPVEVKETADNVLVTASVPGVDPQDLDIEVTSDTVSINYQTEKEKEDKDERWHTKERIYGAFSRTITLPNPIDTNKVKSECKNGLLTLTLPKREETKPKKVKVEVK